MKIKSPHCLQELFSFINQKRKYKIIKYNKYLLKKLDTSIKEYFYQKKIEKYNFKFIENYWIQFKNEFKDISYDLFLNILSNKKDFILNIEDKDFNSMIDNKNFKENIRIEIKEMRYNDLPRILLIKEDKLTNIAINAFKTIFTIFSTNGKMSKQQSIQFIQTINENSDYVNKLFSYDSDKDGFLKFEDFIKYYYNLIKSDLNFVWNNLKKLGYDKFLNENNLENVEYNINELKEKYVNFFKIINANKISLCYNIDKIFIDYLNKKEIFINLKEIDISILNLEILIELNIICPNLEELNLFILSKDSTFKYNEKEIINIFPNISFLKVYIFNDFNLMNLLNNLNNTKIDDLEIYYKTNINSKIESNIIMLNQIKNLKLNVNGKIFIELFNKIKFPNLENYKINLEEIKETEKEIENIDDYNLVNILLMKKRFILKDLINLPNKLKSIKYLDLNLKRYSFIWKKNKNYLELKLYDELKDYDLSIDEKEISKYNKIKIEGLSKFKKLKDIEIIEDKNVNLCDINLNINKCYIKNYKEIRSIYCEEENNISIIKDIIDKIEFKKLKEINLKIDYMEESDEIYNYLSKLIKNSKNLKSLILRINLNQNISIFLSLIEDLKFLKILNINGNKDKSEEELLTNYPKLKERKYYLKI